MAPTKCKTKIHSGDNELTYEDLLQLSQTQYLMILMRVGLWKNTDSHAYVPKCYFN